MLSPGHAVALDRPGSMVDVIGSIAVVASQMMRGQAPPQIFFPRTAPVSWDRL